MFLYGRSLVRLTDHHLLLAPNQVVAIGKTESMCAKLRTVAATIEITQRDHSIIACSRHIYMGVVLRAHPVRGELHIQRNAN